ncbi:LAME_0F06876g1_1 [Lachancea meyersii CBS 8951]|uniref:LAME_0F06876g1_1 n=1 Tax=Lachancea meyersii CBS 8951 TaxID=1266667 RepID=A0A1G4JU30_9SACH|nr:LAME_0F06876g1_1 [Lachancea meyersii CBS 8951]
MDRLAEPLAPKLRKRVLKACDYCRKRKIKCGMINPVTGMCDNCVKFNVPCTFKHHQELERHRLASGIETGGASSTRKFRKTGENSLAKVDMYPFSEPQSGWSVTTPNSPAQALEGKLEALETQIRGLVNLLSQQHAQVHASTAHTQPEQQKDRTFPGLVDVSPRPKQKRYTSSLITKRRIAWLRKRAQFCHGRHIGSNATSDTDLPAVTSFSPLMDVFVMSSKWYIAEVKKLIDFSNPFVPMNGPQLYPLPSQPEMQKMMEVCQSRLFEGAFSIVGHQDLADVVNRYYADEKLSYSELLLVDIWVCVCTAYNVNGTNDCHLKDSSPDMHTRESHMLLNCMYQYHKVSLISEGLRSVQALLLLYQYVHSKVSANVAYSIFCVAQRFAQEVGLHKRKTYEGLSLEESSRRLKMWYMCIAIDAQLSLAFCRAPLINFDETEIFTESFFADFIAKHQLSSRKTTRQIDSSYEGSLKHSMSLLLSFPDTLLLGGCYYGMELNRISAKIYTDLLRADSMSNATFDEVLRKALSILSELKEWEESLPEELSLEHHQDHIGNLKNFHFEGDVSDYHLDILSTSVLSFHFERLHLMIVVCQMMSSFIFDNEDIHSRSSYNVELINQNALRDLRSSGMQIITIWPQIKFFPHMLHRMFYIFCVGSYGLLLTSIGFAHDEETATYITALLNVYEYLCNEGDSKLLKDSIKWNVTMFIYTFILTLAIHCFNCSCAEAGKYKFEASSISDRFGFWMARCELNKVTSVNQLREHLNIFASCVDLPADGPENDAATLDKMGADGELPRVLHVFSEVDVNDFNCLLSSLPIQIVSRDNLAPANGPQSVENKFGHVNSTHGTPNMATGLMNNFDGGFGMNLSPSDGNQMPAPTSWNDQIEFETALDHMLFERDFVFPAMM